MERLWQVGDYFTAGGHFYEIIEDDKGIVGLALNGRLPASNPNYRPSDIDNALNGGSWAFLHRSVGQRLKKQHELGASTGTIVSTVVPASAILGSPTMVINRPTANCQIACIAAYESLGTYPADIKRRLIELYKASGQPQFLIDIHTRNRVRVVDVFSKDDIVFEQPYTSTNGSQMTMLLVKTQNLK